MKTTASITTEETTTESSTQGSSPSIVVAFEEIFHVIDEIPADYNPNKSLLDDIRCKVVD